MDLVPLPEEAMLEVRGKEIGMIFQDPMSSLNPVATVAKQIVEVLRSHTDLGRTAARGQREQADRVITPWRPDAATGARR